MLGKKITGSIAWAVFWLAITIGAMEFVLMYLLSTYSAVPPLLHSGQDTLILTAIVSPLLYAYLYRRQRAEIELARHRDHLEEVVDERTTELKRVNQELEDEISQHRRAEERLEKLALFARLNPAPLLRFDDRGAISFVNPAAVAILGGGAQIGTALVSLLPGIADTDLEHCIREGLTIPHEVSIGEQHFLFTIRGVPELNIGHIYGTDITDRKRREELQARFELVFNAVADGVYVTDTERRVVLWNPAAERITGWKAAEVIGQHCADFLAKEDEAGNPLCQTAGCPLAMVLATGETSPARSMWQHTADGRRIPVSASAAPLKGSGGNTIGMVEVFRDTSREVEIDQMKSDFVSIVSHELRTPLSSIKGFIELLLTRNAPPQTQQEWLQILQSESNRLSLLIDDLLDLSRIESGRVSLQPETLDLAPLIAERLAALQPALEQHRLRQQLPPGLPPVSADRRRLERILDNLLSNAIKYSPDGGEITITAHRQGDWLQVSVADQGIGIPRDKLEVIFARFQQLDSFITRGRGGAGLGLAITRASVELHGGRIWAESEPGKGSTFHFTLPLADKGGRNQNG